MAETTNKKSRRKCQSCKRRTAVYRTGSDGFNAQRGMLVCDNWSCRSEASGGYPVTFHAINPER